MMLELISTFPLCGWNTDPCLFSVWVWKAAAPTAAAAAAASRRTPSPWLHCFLASHWLLVAISYTVHLPSLVYWKIASGSECLSSVPYVTLVPARVLFRTTSPVFIWDFLFSLLSSKMKELFLELLCGLQNTRKISQGLECSWKNRQKKIKQKSYEMRIFSATCASNVKQDPAVFWLCGEISPRLLIQEHVCSFSAG